MAVVIEDLTPIEEEIADGETVEVEQEEVVEAGGEADGNEQEAEAETDEVVVSIGDEPPPEEEEKTAPDWVRELRKSHREQAKRIRELESEKATPTKESTPQLGKKPTLEEHDYDADKFEQALTDWHDRKRKVEETAAQAKKQEEDATKAWNDKLAEYAKSKAALKVSDYDDAEAAVMESFNVTQQGIIVKGSKSPATLIYAIGKNAAEAKRLAGIKDVVEFTWEVAQLETKLKVTQKKVPPPPEKVVTGTGRVSGSSDATLERLRAEAEKTGDMSKVVAYKRSKRAA